jgi:hypothetical protein
MATDHGPWRQEEAVADTMTIDRPSWQGFFDSLSEDHHGEMITMEVLAQQIGDQVEAERLPFNYASYDPKDDVVVIGVGGDSPRFPVILRHMIWHPGEVDFANVPDPVLRVVDKDGEATLTHFYPQGQGAGPSSP